MTKNQEIKLQRIAINRKNRLKTQLFRTHAGLKINSQYQYWPLGDFVDHLKIYNLITEKKYSIAAGLIGGLDTASRDNIPEYIYEKIYLEE